MTPKRFLEASGADLSDDTLRQVNTRMQASIREGLAGGTGCLQMLPAYVPPCPSLPTGEAIALDAGGTNVRAAMVRFAEGGVAEVLDMRRAQLPGGDGREVDRASFFEGLAELVATLGRKDLPVGFVFSYPTRILPDRDGILLRWTKEVRAEGVVGCRVGRELANALRRHHDLPPGAVTVLNDTVAALAAGSARQTGGGIGLIVGTGTNMAYFETREAITKLRPDAAGASAEQAINMESGNFDGVPLTRFDEALDEASGDPGRQRMEKQVSGRYLGELARLVLSDAAHASVLSPELSTALAAPESLGTKHLANALSRPATFEGPLTRAAKADRAALRALIRAVVRRSARLVAAGLSAVIDHLGPRAAPVWIVAEGTLFWQMPGYRETVERTLAKLAPPQAPSSDGAPRFVLLRIDEANLIGAAAAALS